MSECGETDGRRHDVVGALVTIDMVVGIDTSHMPRPGEVLGGGHGDRLVEVHVQRGPGPRGIHRDHEGAAKPVCAPFQDGCLDGSGHVNWDVTEAPVHPGRGELDVGDRPDEGKVVADWKASEHASSTLGLWTPASLGGKPHTTEGIVFESGSSWHGTPLSGRYGRSTLPPAPMQGVTRSSIMPARCPL